MPKYIWVAHDSEGNVQHCYISDTKPEGVKKGNPPVRVLDADKNIIPFKHTKELDEQELGEIIKRSFSADDVLEKIVVKKGRPQLREVSSSDRNRPLPEDRGSEEHDVYGTEPDNEGDGSSLPSDEIDS